MADPRTDADPDGGAPRHVRRTVIVVAVIVVALAGLGGFLAHALAAGKGAGSGDPAATATYDPSSKSTAAASAPPLPTPHPTAPFATAPHHAGGGTVSLDTVATPKPGVVVHVSDLQSVQGTGSGIGEISGPAIRFDVTVTNDSSATLPLSTAVVNVSSGSAKTPADELTTSRTPFPASVAPGKSATAVYTFTLAKADRKNVQVSFDYRAGTPVVVFTGSFPS